MVKADEKLIHNYTCPHPQCEAPLQLLRIQSPLRGREDTFYPHCMNRLAPRDGEDMLQYRLVKRAD
jgi:hypothetical protein